MLPEDQELNLEPSESKIYAHVLEEGAKRYSGLIEEFEELRADIRRVDMEINNWPSSEK